MLLLDNFVHADLHPGNIHVTFMRKRLGSSLFSSSFMHSLMEGEEECIDAEALEALRAIRTPEAWSRAMQDLQAEGYKPVMVFLDAGLVSVLSDQNMSNFLDLFSAIVNFDGAQVAQLMIDRSKLPHSVQKPEDFKRHMHTFLRRLQLETLALSRIRVGDILGTVLAMVRNHHIKIEGDFVNVAISIMLLEGMARRLNPDMDLLKRAIPVLGVASVRAGTPAATQAVAGSVFWRVWIYSWLAGFITHVPGPEGNTFAPDS
jgi:aarF domain-containing kinase